MLKDVAARLIEKVSLVDVVGRYGDDTFALLLFELSDSATAVKIAESIRGVVAAMAWNGCSITAGFGIALSPDHAGDLRDLIRLADLALNTSKVARKGRVTLADR